MENEKKSSALLIGFLVVVIIGLTALDIYQDRVITIQRDDLRWLMTHATIRTELPAPAKGAPATSAPAATPSDQKPATPRAAATEAAAAVTPSGAAAKP